VAFFSRRRFYPLRLRRELGRELLGVEDGDRSTGEYKLLRAVEEGDLAALRVAAARKDDPLVGKDLLALVTAHIAANEQKEFIRYSVDVPAKVWHDAARAGRVEGRSFRSVLTDYLTRGWEEYAEQRRHADKSREALGAELRRFRGALEECAARPAAGDTVPTPEVMARLDGLAAAVRRLEDGEQARANALVAMVVALNERKWIPKSMIAQLQHDGWLG
jgi:hypothetical protein